MSINIEEKKRIFYVLKTPEGYLHKYIDEGLGLDEGELNYSFTDDPFEAYDFYEPDGHVPKYLDNFMDICAETMDEVCKYLNGKMVQISVTETIEWQEIE